MDIDKQKGRQAETTELEIKSNNTKIDNFRQPKGVSIIGFDCNVMQCQLWIAQNKSAFTKLVHGA